MIYAVKVKQREGFHDVYLCDADTHHQAVERVREAGPIGEVEVLVIERVLANEFNGLALLGALE